MKKYKRVTAVVMAALLSLSMETGVLAAEDVLEGVEAVQEDLNPAQEIEGDILLTDEETESGAVPEETDAAVQEAPSEEAFAVWEDSEEGSGEEPGGQTVETDGQAEAPAESAEIPEETEAEDTEEPVADLFGDGEEILEFTDEAETFASGGSLTVTAAQIRESGAVRAIEKALSAAGEQGTADAPCTVTVEKGSYELNDTLHIYSNTTLVLDGVTLTRTQDGCNMLRAGSRAQGDESTGVTGYYFENITIQGGTFDGGKLGGAMVKVGHARNFVMKNVTLQNVYNGHLMETSGVDGLTAQKCRFINQLVDEGDSATTPYEALQLDVLCKKHTKNYRPENLTTKNVVIEGCTFRNVPRGVGSHTGIINNPMNGIRITNCTFEDTKSAAIQGQNWINCTIADNKIKNTPRGISVYYIRDNGRGTFLPSVPAKQGGVSTSMPDGYRTPSGNMNIVISNNNISVNASADPYSKYERAAILVSGNEITAPKGFGDGAGNLPKGNYYASGVTVSGNTINTKGHGIRLYDTRNAKVTDNIINASRPKDANKINYYGIQTTTLCSGNTITGNVIRNVPCNGIHVYKDSSAVSVSSNTIESPGKYGIDIESASVDTIKDNRISDTASVGIFVFKNASVKTLANNTVSNTGSHGISINTKASATKISGNTVSGAKETGIAVGASKVKNVSGNTIKKSKGCGIQVYNKSTCTNVTDNTVSKADNIGILFSSGSKGTKISQNTVLNTKDPGIYVAGDSKVKKVADNYTLAAPKLSSAANKKGKKISVQWKKVKGVSGYEVSYKTGKKTKTLVVKGQNKSSAVISKLKKKSVYEVRVRSYKKTGSTTAYSAWSNAKKVKVTK